MTRTITQEEHLEASRLFIEATVAFKKSGEYCKSLIALLDDVEPGATTDAVFGGDTDIDVLLSKLGITVEE